MDPLDKLIVKSQLIDAIRSKIFELMDSGIPKSQIELLPTADRSILFVRGTPHTEFYIEAEELKILTIPAHPGMV